MIFIVYFLILLGISECADCIQFRLTTDIHLFQILLGEALLLLFSVITFVHIPVGGIKFTIR